MAYRSMYYDTVIGRSIVRLFIVISGNLLNIHFHMIPCA